MPVVAVVNSKGGVGKTTASLLLGTVLAEQGAPVSIIDADPNRHLVAWRTGSSASPVKIIGDIEDGRLVSTIDTERRQTLCCTGRDRWRTGPYPVRGQAVRT